MFFIISGFLTTYTFNDSKSFKDWFVNKLLRFYPFAMIACVASLIIAAIIYAITRSTLTDSINYGFPTIITSLTLTHTGWIKEFSPAINNPTWYLCILTLCYLLYWCLQRLFNKIGLSSVWGFAAISVLMVPLYYLVTHGYSNIPFFRLGNIRGYGSFFVGCAICAFFRSWQRKMLIVTCIGLWLLSAVGCIRFGLSSWYILTYSFFPAIVLTSLLLPQLECSTLKTAGAISFEVYLWQVPLLDCINGMFLIAGWTVNHTYLTMILFCVLVWIVATGVYQWIEKPVSAWIRKRWLQ